MAGACPFVMAGCMVGMSRAKGLWWGHTRLLIYRNLRRCVRVCVEQDLIAIRIGMKFCLKFGDMKLLEFDIWLSLYVIVCHRRVGVFHIVSFSAGTEGRKVRLPRLNWKGWSCSFNSRSIFSRQAKPAGFKTRDQPSVYLLLLFIKKGF